MNGVLISLPENQKYLWYLQLFRKKMILAHSEKNGIRQRNMMNFSGREQPFQVSAGCKFQNCRKHVSWGENCRKNEMYRRHSLNFFSGFFVVSGEDNTWIFIFSFVQKIIRNVETFWYMIRALLWNNTINNDFSLPVIWKHMKMLSYLWNQKGKLFHSIIYSDLILGRNLAQNCVVSKVWKNGVWSLSLWFYKK